MAPVLTRAHACHSRRIPCLLAAWVVLLIPLLVPELSGPRCLLRVALVLLLGLGAGPTSAERLSERHVGWPLLCGGLLESADLHRGWPGALAPTQRRGNAALLGPGLLAEQPMQASSGAAAPGWLRPGGGPRRRLRGGLAERQRSLAQPSNHSKRWVAARGAGSPRGTLQPKNPTELQANPAESQLACPHSRRTGTPSEPQLITPAAVVEVARSLRSDALLQRAVAPGCRGERTRGRGAPNRP